MRLFIILAAIVVLALPASAAAWTPQEIRVFHDMCISHPNDVPVYMHMSLSQWQSFCLQFT